jgi:hypothetical protein
VGFTQSLGTGNRQRIDREISQSFFFTSVSALQHGGTNFTAFRIIDTSKPEVKAVIHDIVNKEIAQGRMIEMQVNILDILDINRILRRGHYYKILDN